MGGGGPGERRGHQAHGLSKREEWRGPRESKGAPTIIRRRRRRTPPHRCRETPRGSTPTAGGALGRNRGVGKFHGVGDVAHGRAGIAEHLLRPDAGWGGEAEKQHEEESIDTNTSTRRNDVPARQRDRRSAWPVTSVPAHEHQGAARSSPCPGVSPKLRSRYKHARLRFVAGNAGLRRGGVLPAGGCYQRRERALRLRGRMPGSSRTVPPTPVGSYGGGYRR